MDNVDYSLLEKRLNSVRSGGGASSTPPGGGDMESRILNIENSLTDVRISLGKVETRLDKLENYIEKHVVTRGQLAAWSLAVVVSVLGAIVAGGFWVIQQYLSPILSQIAG